MLWPLLLIGIGVVVFCHALGRPAPVVKPWLSVSVEAVCGTVCCAGAAGWLVWLAVN